MLLKISYPCLGGVFCAVRTIWGGSVVRLQVSFGDYPIWYIDYDRVTGSIRCENKINGSRDGGLRHPPGLFEPRVFQIIDAQKEKLFAVLKAVDFSRWKTDAYIIENMRGLVYNLKV